MPDLSKRSEFLVSVMNKYASLNDRILEIGHGDGRNLARLMLEGYTNVLGIDKDPGPSIQEAELLEYDIIYTMSTLFLIPREDEWVFEKIAKAAKKFLITIEGEVTKGHVIGRNYKEIFEKFGFLEVEHQENVFNEYGHLRVFKKI